MARKLVTLQGFTEALSSAVTMKDVAAVLFRLGLDRFGAKAIGIVWQMEPRRLELVYGHGLSESEFRHLDEAARAGERLPIRDAILARRPVWLETPEEIRAAYPVLEPLRVARGEYGCAVVPLVVGQSCPGVIGFTFDRPHHFSGKEREFIETLARLAAQAFDRARLYEAERRARNMAEHVTRVEEHLIGVVGHDLRTPLGAIRLSAEALLQRGDLAPGARRLVERIDASAGRMAAIVRDLLDLSHARRGRGISVVPEAVDAGVVARQAIAELVAQAQAGIDLDVQGDVTMEADPARLAQVVSNLVGNSVQHGGGSRVRVGIIGEADDVSIRVHNDGPVIPADVLPAIFEPFRRGPSAAAGRERAGSVGLGLFIVREIARAHGGSVEVDSTAGQGTTFTVHLPRRAPQRAPTPVP